LDWTHAIDRNRSALIVIIITLMKSLGLVDGGILTTLPYHLYRKALLVLRPAEVAVRRLIMIAAYDMELRGFNLSRRAPVNGLPLKDGAELAGEVVLVRRKIDEQGQRLPTFNLIDPLRTFGGEQPDYSSFGQGTMDEQDPQKFAPIPATGLGRRLWALKHALNTIEKQARRLTRWYGQRDAALEQNRPHRLSPLRPGPPPHYQKRSQNEVEMVLKECHALALYARERPDSS
jgi:hypothetical protein